MLRERYHYINVDESQDTSLVQHEIIKLVAHPKTIFSWLGMRTRAFMGLGLLFPKRFLILKKLYPDAKFY